MANLTEAERRATGKRGALWSMEIYYIDYHADTDFSKLLFTNLTGEEVIRMRSDIFRIGVTKVLDPGHWEVIFPFNLRRIELYRQRKYFD